MGDWNALVQLHGTLLLDQWAMSSQMLSAASAIEKNQCPRMRKDIAVDGTHA